MYSPLQGLFRKTTADVQLRDVLIPEGSIVMVRYGAANRDPQKFEQPEKIAIYTGKMLDLTLAVTWAQRRLWIKFV